jgi:tetratricopeptide (TPR) repeat protein
LRKDNLKEAKEELEAITAMIKDPELEGIIANYTNPTSAIALVAQEVIRGEIAMAEGNRSKAIDHLKKAVELEDALVYSEPAAWHIPVRQSLGAVLLTTEDYAEAEKIYREDLDNLRQNGWSLMGLYKSLIAQDKVDEANKIKEEFRKAWEHADIEIETSIL